MAKKKAEAYRKPSILGCMAAGELQAPNIQGNRQAFLQHKFRKPSPKDGPIMPSPVDVNWEKDWEIRKRTEHEKERGGANYSAGKIIQR